MSWGKREDRMGDKVVQRLQHQSEAAEESWVSSRCSQSGVLLQACWSLQPSQMLLPEFAPLTRGPSRDCLALLAGEAVAGKACTGKELGRRANMMQRHEQRHGSAQRLLLGGFSGKTFM